MKKDAFPTGKRPFCYLAAAGRQLRQQTEVVWKGKKHCLTSFLGWSLLKANR